MARLVIVGGGRMGEALLGGLVAAGWSPSDLAVVEVVPERAAALAERFGGLVTSAEPVAADGAVIAVKPPAAAAATSAAVGAGARRILSIAAGVPLATLEAAAGTAAVVRAMPNTPSLVGGGAAAISGGASATDADLDWAADILGAVGVVVRVAEPLLDAVTGLSGSGPAYVFLVAEALVDAGVQAGLPRDVATLLANHTLAGSARMLVETGEHPAALRNAVTSPGGTTAAALHRLEAAGVRAALADAVLAAAARSRELADG